MLSDLHCCHTQGSLGGLGAPEVLGGQVDPEWGDRKLWSAMLTARPSTLASVADVGSSGPDNQWSLPEPLSEQPRREGQAAGPEWDHLQGQVHEQPRHVCL